LTTEEARKRLAQYGPNETTTVKRAGPIKRILMSLANPLVLVLLLASAVSAALGDPTDAFIIVTIVFFSTALDFYQTRRSQNAADKLQSQVALTATTLRDGNWVEVPRREVVTGDVIRLSAGDLVPADARLIEARDLHANQAALTGESIPAEKEAGESDASPENPADARNVVFLGSSIESGTANALVVAIGRNTSFGDIVARLAARPPETEFDRGTRQFGLFITRVVFLLVLFVFLVNAGIRHQPVLDTLLFAIALAVGLTPEFLPVIITVTLSQGAVHMSRQKVIVKNLASIQNFGSMDVLCSDKTGTLTSGNMTFECQVDALGNPTERVLALAFLNSSFETGIKNELDRAILDSVRDKPLDPAVLQQDKLDVKDFTKLDEIPFDFERRRLSIVLASDGRRLMVTKGAPESVMEVSASYETGGQVHPLDADVRAHCQKAYQDLSAQGYRVLAVAYREVPQQPAYHIPDEKELTLAGYIAFYDPPLPDAAEVIKQLAEDGVRVKVISGDSDLVAAHICQQVGLDFGHIVLGEEIGRATDAALAQIAERGNVFARVSPSQKTRIILALKSRGHVVGYMGDGINDAPSLHNADVGISVATAVDVAKGAADIILMERSLKVLHNGILEGRKAFGNVMKYLLMGTSSNFGNVFSMAGATVFLPFLPMLPTQILLNNFLYDLAQITIPTDNVDASFTHKPRRWNIDMIRNFMLLIGPISSIYDFITFAVMLFIFHANEVLFHTGWFVESLATQTLVLFVIRTAGNPLRSRPSTPLAITTILITIVGVVLPYTPLAGLLGFTPLPLGYFLFLILATSTYLLLVEAAKRRVMSRLIGD
jgi:Mg2+-importing ATPase